MRVATACFVTWWAAHQAKAKSIAVHIWGNGIYHPRPDAILAFDNFQPKHIRTYDSLMPKDVFFGENHKAILTRDGALHLFAKQPLQAMNEGRNDHVRQGHKHLALKERVSKAAFTKGFIFALTQQGNVFQWQLDQEGKIADTARKIQVLKQVKDIATGQDHFVCLNEAGQVFAMGDDSYGQCGTQEIRIPPFPERRVRFPLKVNGIEVKVTKIACGSHHTLVVDEAGSLLGWGSNTTLQLSQEYKFSSAEDPLLASSRPLRITKNLQQVTVKQIAAGDGFSVASGVNRVSGQTEAYGVGVNLFGQLGTGYMGHIMDVTKIQALSNYKIKDAEGQARNVELLSLRCGQSHCLAHMSVGGVMAWGANEFGQQGNKKRVANLRPVLLKQYQGLKVAGIAAGHTSSAVLLQS